MTSRFNPLSGDKFAECLNDASEHLRKASHALDYCARYGSDSMVAQLNGIHGQDDLDGVALRLTMLADRLRLRESVS